MPKPNPPPYRAYILYCWAEVDVTDNQIIWRFNLKDPNTGKRRGFTSLTALIVALQDELMTNEYQRAEYRGNN